MPWTEHDNFLCGALMKRNDTGTWIRRFLVLDFSGRVVQLYREDVEYKEELARKNPITECDLCKITNVRNSPNPPKMMKFCFEFTLASRETHMFSADNEEDRSSWVEAFKRVAMNKGFSATLETSTRANSIVANKKEPEAMRTTIVGGVVVKTSVQLTPNDKNKPNKPENAMQRSKGSPGAPKVLKAGFAVKQGAVRKNWKKRFFILTEASFSYFRGSEDCEPIKSVDSKEIQAVVETHEFKDKGHMFAVTTPGRIFYVQCEEEEEVSDWLAAFYLLPQFQKSNGAPVQQNTQSTTDPQSIDDDDDSYETDDNSPEEGLS